MVQYDGVMGHSYYLYLTLYVSLTVTIVCVL